MTRSGGPSRTSCGRAQAGPARTDVPQLCNSGSRSKQRGNLSHRSRYFSNPQTPPWPQQSLVLTIAQPSRCAIATPPGPQPAKLQPGFYRGGFSSPASQPTASVFIGSTAKDATSVRSQVEHSKVRFSNPALAGEMRANAIRCLHTGHIGRSFIRAVPHWLQKILITPPRNLIQK